MEGANNYNFYGKDVETSLKSKRLIRSCEKTYHTTWTLYLKYELKRHRTRIFMLSVHEVWLVFFYKFKLKILICEIYSRLFFKLDMGKI